MEAFLALFGTFTAACLGLGFWYVGDAWQDEVRRERWAGWLSNNAGRFRYRKLVEGVLDAFSGFLGRREARIRKAPG